VFEQLMVDVGPGAVQRVGMRLGIDQHELIPARCAMALGGLPQGVSPLEQAAAFATFAAKGVYAQPYSIVRIKNRRGEVVYEHQLKTSPALLPEEAGVVNAALEGVVDDGTGTAGWIGRPLAGKTGTTENHADAWFIGYVPQLATAVWVGHPDALVPMTDVHGIAVSGGTYPARVFARYMQRAVAGLPVEDVYTASPDDLALHRLDAVPTTTSTSSSSSTSSTTAPPVAPAPPIEDLSTPSPQADQSDQGPSPTPQPSPVATTTSQAPRSTSTTQKKQQQTTSQSTLGG